MTRRLAATLFVAAAAALAGCENSGAHRTDAAPTSRTVSPDARILSILRAHDVEEVRVGQLAQKKGGAAARQYGEVLVREHTAHKDQVEATAKAASVLLLDPDEAMRMQMNDRGANAMPDPVARLESLQGSDFDRALSELMTQGHRDLIQMVEASRGQTQTPSVRELLDSTLPVLKRHEQMAADLVKPMR